MSEISTDQKWYHLGTILSTPFSLPMIIIGNQLANQYGAGVAICSILVGNLLLWLIGLTVITMAIEQRSNAIANVRDYLGSYGALFIWLVMMVSILNWFAYQLNATIPSIGDFVELKSPRAFLILGISIGLLTTLLSLGGIQILKWATFLSTPFIFLYHILTMAYSDTQVSLMNPGLSLPAFLTTMLILLPGTINLPTLFRHSQSKAHSYLGLSVLTFLSALYEISGIWMTFTPEGNIPFNGFSIYSTATFAFLFLTLIYINLVNIYYASALWERYIPRIAGMRGYFIFGLMGTAYFALTKTESPTLLLADLTNSYLASLGVVLLISFLIRMVVKHRPRRYELLLNLSAWLIGCVVSTLWIIQDITDTVTPIIMGSLTSMVAFVLIIFIEENVWAAKKIQHYKNNH